MSIETKYSSKQDYENRYKKGYGLIYPESHIIRVYKQVIEWEFGVKKGKIFDFGCGVGSNLKFFMEQGFTPFGCDVSETAVLKCKENLNQFQNNFFVNHPVPKITEETKERSFDIFLSNQVLYYLSDINIKKVSEQAWNMLKKGGIFVVSMMSYECWYAKHITGVSGDFKNIKLCSNRENLEFQLNFKIEEYSFF